MGGTATVRRETAGVTTRLIVSYVREHAGTDGVQALLDAAGETRPAVALEDEATWSTYEQKIALFGAAAELLDDPLVALHIGRTVLARQVAAPVKLMLRTLGSPAMVLRNIGRAAARFSTCTTMYPVEVGRRSATIGYRLHEGYEPSRFDCDYNLGLLPAVTELFGLPPARIQHRQCQIDGAPECVYELEWRPRARVWFPGRARRAEVAYLRDQLSTVVARSEALTTSTVDLVSPDELSVVLQRIATRAVEAVRAQRFVLAVVPREAAALEVHHDGVDDDEAHRVARELAAGRVDQSGMLVVEIASARRRYGHLAAIYDDANWFFPEEGKLLAAYARHAAVALDAATALEEARERGATSAALLELSRALAQPGSVDDVVTRVAASVVPVVGARHAGILMWDADAGVMRMRAAFGYPEEIAAALRAFAVRPEESPELASLLLHPEPRRYRADELAPTVQGALVASGTVEVVIVPIVVRGNLAGVIAAGRGVADPPFRVGDQLTARMAGLADQAALALERAQLRDQEQAALERLRADEAHIKHLAFHDPLTGLANGRLFNEHLVAAVTRARRHDLRVGVLFCDLDRFKNVNDSLGHVVGNRLLKEVATRLRNCVRESDVLARLGGDEFTILIENLHDPDDAGVVAAKVLEAASRAVDVDGHELRVSASVGIALYPDDGADADALLKNADAAMYAAKVERGAWARYRPEMNARTGQLLLLESGLPGALERRELEVHYQPQVRAGSGELVAVEALVRWRHPSLGLVPPGEFVPLAEEAGLIFHVDAYVLQQACLDAVRWHAAGNPLRVAVNLSSRHVQQPGLVGLVASALAQSGLPPACLELELTETAAMQAGAVEAVLADLKDLGVTLALDDFGTGYAAYRLLKTVPVDRIKLDRTFISGLPDDTYDRAIVTALVSMAHELGLVVTAEGVETDAQAEFLVAEGCDELQGWRYGRAVPVAEIDARLLAGRGDAAPVSPADTLR